MDQESLNRFLAHVRKMRFIDYLDPIGVTAEEALAQRLRWAKRNVDDPQHGEEAAFLLAHAVELSEVVRREVEVDADDEWTDVFSAVKPDSPLLTWMRRDEAMVAGEPEEAPDEEAAEEDAPPDPAMAPTDAMHLSRIEDITPPPMDAAEVEQALVEAAAEEESAAEASPETPAPAPQRPLVEFDAPVDVRAADEENSDAETLILNRDKLGIPQGLHRRTPPPSEVARIVMTPEPSPQRDPVLRPITPPRTARSDTPPARRTPTPPPAVRTETPPPAPRATPASPAPAGRAGTPIATGRNGMPNRDYTRTTTPPPPLVRTGTPAPQRRTLPTPTPSMQRRTGPGAAPRPVRFPLPLLGGGVALALAAGAAALYLYGNRTSGLAPVPEPTPVVAVVEPTPEPVAEPTPEPVAETQPAPETEPAPEPVAVAPEPAPEPVAVVPEPAPEPVAVVPEPPAPEPAPPPTPLVTASVVSLVPAPAPAPQPARAPRPPAPPPPDMPDLSGTWNGDADGAALRLTLSSAGGAKMTGTADLDTPDGAKHMTVTGIWKDGRLELSGRGDALLFGYVTADGGNGTLMIPGIDPFAWSVGAR